MSLLGDLVQAAEARGFLLLLLAQPGLSAQENKLRLESSTELGEWRSGTESMGKLSLVSSHWITRNGM